MSQNTPPDSAGTPGTPPAGAGDDEEIRRSVVIEVIRTTLPGYLQRLIDIRRTVAPYFFAVVLGYLTVYDIGQGPSLQIPSSITIFGANIESGITAHSARAMIVYGIAIAIWVLFTRFGFVYYQAIDTTRRYREMIGETVFDQSNEFNDSIRSIFLASIRDAYFIDVLLIAFTEREEDVPFSKKAVSWFMLFAFLIFIGLGQYFTVMAAAASSSHAVVCVFLLVYYAIFYLVFLIRFVEMVNAARVAGLFQFVMKITFYVTVASSVIANAYGAYQYWDANNKFIEYRSKIMQEQKLQFDEVKLRSESVFSRQIDIKNFFAQEPHILKLKKEAK